MAMMLVMPALVRLAVVAASHAGDSSYQLMSAWMVMWWCGVW